jgi:hypothetical protein
LIHEFNVVLSHLYFRKRSYEPRAQETLLAVRHASWIILRLRALARGSVDANTARMDFHQLPRIAAGGKLPSFGRF